MLVLTALWVILQSQILCDNICNFLMPLVDSSFYIFLYFHSSKKIILMNQLRSVQSHRHPVAKTNPSFKGQFSNQSSFTSVWLITMAISSSINASFSWKDRNTFENLSYTLILHVITKGKQKA